MNVQTIHFFRPPLPPPKVYKPTFLGPQTRVLCSITFIVQQQELTVIVIEAYYVTNDTFDYVFM